MKNLTPKKILVSASDPGSANAVLSVTKELLKRGEIIKCVLGSKSREIFLSQKIDSINGDELSKKQLQKIFQKDDFKFFLAGASIGKTIDKKLLLFCKEKNIPVMYVLDFWSNYWQRFSDKEKDLKFLPDYICVMDKNAKKEMIKEGFKENDIKITGNPYFDSFISNIGKIRENKKRILFISAPLASDAKNYKKSVSFGYSENRVLKDILDTLSEFDQDLNLVIRLHPRDEKKKYSEFIKNARMAISYDNIRNIKKSLSRSGLIIGMNSVILLQAALAGKRVISYQPNLRAKDILISNGLGLSKLATSKNQLKKLIAQYATGKMRLKEKTKNILIKNATKNVLNFIDKILLT